MSFSGRHNQGKPSIVAGRRSTRQWRGLWLLAGACLFVLGLMIGLYLFFPAEVLKQRIIQEAEGRTSSQVQIEQLALLPILTLDIEGLNVNVNGLPIPLEIDRLKISPLWSSLMSDPGAQFQASAMSGTLSGVVQKSGALRAEAAGLRFDIPVLEPFPCNITGTLSDASIDTETVLGRETDTRISLRLSDATIIGLASLDTDNKGIVVGEINLQAEGRGRNLQIKALTAKGGILDISGEGTLLIGRTAATSRIKLDLQVRPGPNANPNITTLLQLAGEADAEGLYTLRVSGNVTKPSLKSGD